MFQISVQVLDGKRRYSTVKYLVWVSHTIPRFFVTYVMRSGNANYEFEGTDGLISVDNFLYKLLYEYAHIIFAEDGNW